MPVHDQTADATRSSIFGDDGTARPGLVVIFAGRRAACAALPLENNTLVLGREAGGARGLDDPKLSRRHAQVSWSAEGWTVEDLGSRNGTWLDGDAVTGRARAAAPRVLRLADTVILPVADVLPFLGQHAFGAEGPVAGPTLLRAWQTIARIARSGDTLHITGESGAGKELAARTFHDAGPKRGGPFVAVNCAAIPEGVAERLLFGARKGAFSGAVADADGYLQAAHGGTLFLDEVGELDLAVQAKLLRVLETRQVVALGATRPQDVDLRIVSATHRDLRALVSERRLREDLYFRIGRPVVALPPLRARGEEIPWLVERAVRRVGPDCTAHPTLVERCLLREWPGNVRELMAEVQSATQECLADGRTVVESRHLSPTAGVSFAAKQTDDDPATTQTRAKTPRAPTRFPDSEEVVSALRAQQGNVSAAARALGLHRTQLRRLFERYGIDARRFAAPGADDADDAADET